MTVHFHHRTKRLLYQRCFLSKHEAVISKYDQQKQYQCLSHRLFHRDFIYFIAPRAKNDFVIDDDGRRFEVGADLFAGHNLASLALDEIDVAVAVGGEDEHLVALVEERDGR